LKGIIFTEFLDMTAQRFGEDLVDDIIADAQLPHGGAYTSVGIYPHNELIALLSAMAKRTGLAVDSLLEVFGRHLFGRFYHRYPQFMDSVTDPLEFLIGVETIVHTEVRRLYPDAQLPKFETARVSEDTILMNYLSAHDFSSLAVGLISGCADHYQCKLITSRVEAKRVQHGVSVKLSVTRNG
jgi:hypothetical protein